MKALAELTEREVLALAISSEEEDSRIYMAFAEDLAERYSASAKIFEEMAQEEEGHRRKLLELYRRRFGSTLPPIRREDVKGFLRRRPIWLTRNLPLDTIRKEAENMEFQAFSGMFPHRPDDILAAGFAYTGISNQVHGLDGSQGLPSDRNFEALVEICYKAQLKTGWTLQPDFQYIWQPEGGVPEPSGKGTVPNAAVWGVRTTINF